MSAFKNVGKVLTTSNQTLYTAPAGGALVFLGQVANVSATSSDVDTTIWWTDSSNSNAVNRLGYLLTAPAGGAFPLIAKGALVLEAGDTIVGVASAGSSAEVTFSVYEL